MHLYARSDLVHVYVSEAHGGCGAEGGHSRPVENGAPAKIWDLARQCIKCCDHLRHNADQWSTTLAEQPETYDGRLIRERDEKMGKLDRENQLAEALISLQNLGQLPAAFAQVVASITGTPANAVAGQTVCPQGHDNSAGHKFCAECGAPMHAAGPAIEAPQAQDTSRGHTPPGEPEPAARKVRMRDMRLEDLQALARQRGVDAEGTRMDLIGRLKSVPVAA